MIDPEVREETIKVAEALTLMSRRLTDAANSNDMDVLVKTLTQSAESMEQAGALLAMVLQGKLKLGTQNL